MGQLRFLLHDRACLPENALSRVHMCGVEDIPWQSRCYFSGDHLVVERYESDSGSVRVPWRTARHGIQLITTATLMEREAPYLLEVELARGVVYHVRNHLAIWEPVGLAAPASVHDELRQAMRAFAKAATSQHNLAVASQAAIEAIDRGIEAAYQIGKCYAEQALAVRRAATPQLPTLLGVRLDATPSESVDSARLAEAFNFVDLPFAWRAIEAHEGRRDWTIPDQQLQWCQRDGLKVCGGPLVQLDTAGIPDWMYLWEGDFDNLLSFMLDHIKTVVMRYRGRVHLWQAVSRINVGDMLSLDEEQRLRIVVASLECIRQHDPRTPVVVTFDQPWAEYMASESWDLSPLHFADAIVRADIGVAGLGLEINVGTWPQGSLPRDPLAMSRLLDHWSLLGLPLMLVVTSPGAEPPRQGLSNADSTAVDEGVELPSLQAQRRWVEHFIPILLAKNPVQVVLWNQLLDGESNRFQGTGLLGESGDPKPALDALAKLRKSYLV